MKIKKLLTVMMVMLLCGFCFSMFAQAEEKNEKCEGRSKEEAVVIKYTGDYAESIAQEYDYLDKKFGVMGRNYDIIQQSIIAEGAVVYDVLTIKIFASGEQKDIYFDITEPYTELVKQFQKKE